MPPPPDTQAPSLLRLIAEAGVLGDVAEYALGRTSLVRRGRGAGHAVMVVPGFLARDWMTRPLRRALEAEGYRAGGWGLGRNTGATADLIERITARIIALGGGAPVVLVGWSLGGIYAREFACRRPDLVERVVTLGSPFSGDPRANNAWRLYERVAGHPVDAPPIARHLDAKPPVPTIALWSARDGIVAATSARGRPDESDVRIEVDCRHLGFVIEPRAISAVLEAVARPLPLTP